MLGMVCGSLIWGPFADRFGRKHAFGGCSLVITVFGFATAFMRSWWSFAVMRFLVGIGVAGLCISFNLLLEFVPAKHRGQWLNFIELYFTAGSLFTTCISWYVHGNAGTYDNTHLHLHLPLINRCLLLILC